MRAEPMALALLLAACDGSPGATRPCDPLEAVTRPITLGQVVGVGSDQQGIHYLVDEIAGSDRLFMSEGTVLQRQAVAGTGQLGDASDMLTVVSAGTADAPLTVEVQTSRGHTTAMGVLRGPLAGKTFEIGAMGDVLQVLTTDALGGFTLQNLPGTMSVQHLATLADGRQLVVVVPDVDATESDVRVFFGMPDLLIERRVTATAQPRSYSQLTFDVGGQRAVATFASPLNTGVASMLMLGAETFPLTDAAPGTQPTGATFRCF